MHRLTLPAALLLSTTLGAQATDTTTRVRLNGFVDTYYAYDFNRPADGDRPFTTQAVRHDEFNVNLAWLGVTIERRKVRARVALQAGTSVQANYAGEPREGTISGPDVARFIQEAVVGVRLSDDVWVDAGIYYSYLGLESWASSDNPTYTRSLVADYTPYYLSGAKLTWAITPRLTAQVHAMNGWQNISENNRSKAIGSRVDYAVSPAVMLSYANFLGNEQGHDVPSALRLFNQVMAKATLPRGTQLQGQVDAGRQAASAWYGLVLIARQPVTERVALVGRVERFADPDKVVLVTSRLGGFIGNGASLGVDVGIEGGARWRSELRSLRTTESVFFDGRSLAPSRNSTAVVSSLSFAF
ncbi:MAG TPA: porin [Gemmatimonadaceae bacterium]|nr:porin [Gemmatimonadaceae bacterium]